MIRIKITLLVFLSSFLTFNAHSQENKIKKAQEHIEHQKFSEAQAIFIKILEKNPDHRLALYFTELITFKLGNVNKDMIQRLNHIEQQYSQLEAGEKMTDSVKFNVSKSVIVSLKKEITDNAFTRHYLNSRDLDSLKEFKTDYQPSVSQIARINERICSVNYEKIDFNNRIDMINFININGDCSQFNFVVVSLENLDWKNVKKNNSIEGYIEFKSNHAKSKLLDSADHLIQEISWNTAIQRNDFNIYKEFIAKNPKSPHLSEASNRYDTLFWENSRSSLDSVQIINYLKTCSPCGHEDEAQILLANNHWARISSTNDMNTLNNFINKWPNSDKVPLAYNLINILLINKERLSEIPGTTFKNDITWDDRLAIYQNSRAQFLRTKVYPDGKLGVKERIVVNINTLMDVDEIVTGDKNIFYSLIKNDGLTSPKLISNYDGLVGLEIEGFFLSQRLSNSFFACSWGNEIYDAQKGVFIPVEMPKYNLSLNRPTVFPYLRIAYPDYLYSKTYESRGNSQYMPSLYNSDLLYSINQDRFYCIENSGSKNYNVTFGSGKKLCMINNEIYKIENLEQVSISSDLQSNHEEDNHQSIRNIDSKIVTFNDSTFVWYYAKEKVLKINRTNSKLINSIDLSHLTGLGTSTGLVEFKFVEIDQFGRYLYLEWEPEVYEKILTTPYNNSLLAIVDCQNSKFVYIGPHIGLDYTTEKEGWVMTKAVYSYKNQDVKIGKTRQEIVEKHGFSWSITNYSPPVSSDEVIAIETKSLYTIDRSLINLNSLISDDFMLQLNKMIDKLSPIEDIFNQSYVQKRKQFLKDSLISRAHLWVTPSSIDFDSQLFNTEIEPNYDKMVLNHCAKYYIDAEAPFPSGYFQRFIPKLTDLKRQDDLFTFTFRIDSLPMELVQSKIRVSDKYMCSIYKGSREMGRVVQKELPYSLQDSNRITYFFDIVTDEEQFARMINDKIKINDLTVNFNYDWNDSFLLHSFEFTLIEQHHSISKMNLKNYWLDLINELKSQGVSPWEVSLQLAFFSGDDDWKLPLLLRSENLQINGRY